jgi:uncharacterized protein (TIGR03083 family)
MSIPAERAAFFLTCLQADSDRLAEVGRMGLQAPVPSCPGWTVETVLRHTAQVYLHKVEILRLGARPEPWPPPGLADRDALELYGEASAAVIAELAKAGPDVATWTFSPTDRTSAFWFRRMAHETAVHRADAELAHAVLTPIDRELALDGIDEILRLMLGGPLVGGGRHGPSGRRRRPGHRRGPDLDRETGRDHRHRHRGRGRRRGRRDLRRPGRGPALVVGPSARRRRPGGR